MQSFTRLFTCLLSETQVSTIWLQSTLIFCFVWALGSTLTSDSQKKFDIFYRKLLNGENKRYPKSKSFKLNKNQLFPERGIVFDYLYDKKNNGSWITWMDTVDKIQQIPPNARVNHLFVFV